MPEKFPCSCRRGSQLKGSIPTGCPCNLFFSLFQNPGRAFGNSNKIAPRKSSHVRRYTKGESDDFQNVIHLVRKIIYWSPLFRIFFRKHTFLSRFFRANCKRVHFSFNHGVVIPLRSFSPFLGVRQVEHQFVLCTAARLENLSWQLRRWKCGPKKYIKITKKNIDWNEESNFDLVLFDIRLEVQTPN